MDSVIRRVARLLGLATVCIAVVSTSQAQEYTRSIEIAPDDIHDVVVPSEETFASDLSIENIVEAEIEAELSRDHVEDVRTPIFDLCCMCPDADPFIRDTQLDYQINFTHYDVNSISAMANMLTYTSGWYNDFMQIGGNVTNVAVLNEGFKPAPLRSGLLKNGVDSYTSLRRAYVKFKWCDAFFFDEARVTLFRQGIRAPFLGDGGFTCFVPNDFEAYVLEFEECAITGFDFKIAYFDKMRKGTPPVDKNNQDFRSMSKVAADSITPGSQPTSDVPSRGVFSFIAAYEPFTDYTFGGVYHHCQDFVDILYGDMKYIYHLQDDLSIMPTAQIGYQGPNNRDLLDISTAAFWGFELDVDWCGFIASVMYTRNFTDADVNDYWGDVPAYNSMIESDFIAAQEQALGFGINYDFGRWCIPGLKVDANYVFGRMPKGQNEREINFTLDYIFPQPLLQGLWFRFRAARWDTQGGPGSGNFFYDGHSGNQVRRDYRVFIYYTKAII